MTAAGEQSLRRHWWVAALLSLVAIGLGHLYAGRIRWVLSFLAGWLVLLAMFHTPLPSSFGGFAFIYLSLLALWPVTLAHAVVTAWRSPVVVRQAYHRWYFYALYAGAALALMSGLGFGAFEAVGGPPVFGGYKPFRMVSDSMEPTLRRGDYVIVKLASADDPHMSDYLGHVVVYLANEAYVHRLVAMGGDRVAMRAGKLVVNDKVLPRQDICIAPLSNSDAEAQLSTETNGARTYVIQHATTEGAELLRDRDEETLEADQFYILGDSRDYSNDSRMRGALRNEQLVGRALYIFWSDDWSRIGRSLSPDAPIVRADYCDTTRQL